MLNDMDEIENIEKTRAIESILQTMEHFSISIDDLTRLQKSARFDPVQAQNTEQSIDKWAFMA